MRARCFVSMTTKVKDNKKTEYVVIHEEDEEEWSMPLLVDLAKGDLCIMTN